MRTIFRTCSAIVLLTICCNTSFAQAKIGCMDKSLRVQCEQMKHDFKVQGMEVFKDAMIEMNNREPFPVAIQLNANELYQFVFIGNKADSKLYFELFDGADTRLGEKTVEVSGSNNYILYSFIPQKSDLYLVVLSQKIKGFKAPKEFCGSFTILKKVQADKAQ